MGGFKNFNFTANFQMKIFTQDIFTAKKKGRKIKREPNTRTQHNTLFRRRYRHDNPVACDWIGSDWISFDLIYNCSSFLLASY